MGKKKGRRSLSLYRKRRRNDDKLRAPSPLREKETQPSNLERMTGRIEKEREKTVE